MICPVGIASDLYRFAGGEGRRPWAAAAEIIDISDRQMRSGQYLLPALAAYGESRQHRQLRESASADRSSALARHPGRLHGRNPIPKTNPTASKTGHFNLLTTCA